VRDDDEQRRGATSDELLRLIFESATDFAIFTMDPNGITTSWNPGAERLLGYPEADILGKSADVLFPPEEGGTNAAEEERKLARAHGRAEDERWQMRKDGSRIWASGLLMRLSEPDMGFVKILRDRTPQRQAEEQLRASEELFRALATNIPQLVFRTKVTGERTWPSPQWSIFAGQSFADSVGLGWLDAIHPDDRDATLAAWRDAPITGTYYIEHRIRHADSGDDRWHQTRAVPLGDPRDPATEWVGTSTDIHDLRHLHERQKVILAELQHRTRNLLGVVQGIAHQILSRTKSLDEFAEAFTSRLRALGRVQGLLAREGHEFVELRELVEAELSVYGGFEERVKLRGAALPLSGPSAQALALALHELATNAAKYGALATADGTIDINWDRKDDHLRLEWLERGLKKPASAGTRKGYGSELIERALPYQLSAETKLELGTDSVRCLITLPVEHVAAD
jgi:PAS domain S-box-containing protein